MLYKRASYYVSRLLSGQKNVEFTGNDYKKMRESYSVWIFPFAPNCFLQKYEMVPTETRGKVPEFDAISMTHIVFIGIGEKKYENDELFAMLHILFKEKSNAKIKEEKLADLGVYLTAKEVEEMEQMESFMGIFDEHSRQEGEKRLSLLIKAMIANGETDMIQTVLNDEKLKKTYYKKYNIH